MNGATCPHCNQPLSTYSTTLDDEPQDVAVLICTKCDKLLGVIGWTGEPRRPGD